MKNERKGSPYGYSSQRYKSGSTEFPKQVIKKKLKIDWSNKIFRIEVQDSMKEEELYQIITSKVHIKHKGSYKKK